MSVMEDSRNRRTVREVGATRGILEGMISRRVVRLRAVTCHATG